MERAVEDRDPAGRAAEKQRSRDRDSARIASGEISARELNHENDFFGAFPEDTFEIVSIGGRPFGRT